MPPYLLWHRCLVCWAPVFHIESGTPDTTSTYTCTLWGEWRATVVSWNRFLWQVRPSWQHIIPRSTLFRAFELPDAWISVKLHRVPQCSLFCRSTVTGTIAWHLIKDSFFNNNFPRQLLDYPLIIQQNGQNVESGMLLSITWELCCSQNIVAVAQGTIKGILYACTERDCIVTVITWSYPWKHRRLQQRHRQRRLMHACSSS